MKTKIESIIAQVVKINEKYDAIKKFDGENFNIFSILNMERNEVETHSRFIYELLNPNGTHNQGDIFLNLFIENILKLTDYKKVKIPKREDLTSKNRRIDFTIETESYQIGIEMKIDAPDQEGQLLDYYEELKSRCSNNQKYKLYYLTLSGYQAEESSTRDKLRADKDYILISFESDILNWIDACIEKSATIPTLREGLVHYRNLIRKITNSLPNAMEREMEDIIRNSKDAKAMQVIVDAYARIWAKKEKEFWEKLWIDIENKSKEYDFIVTDYLNIWYDENGEKNYEDYIIDELEGVRNKKYDYAGFALIKRYTNKASVMLEIIKVNLENSIALGISFYGKKDINLEIPIMNGQLDSICKSIEFIEEEDNKRWRNINERIIFYSKYGTEPTYKLFDNDEFGVYIEIVSKEVMSSIKSLVDNEDKMQKSLSEEA